MANRIPPKGTPGYRLYWWHRHMVENKGHDLKGARAWVEAMPDGERKVFFLRAIELEEKALELWKDGHSLPYTTPEAPP